MNRIMLSMPKLLSRISLIFMLLLLPILGRAQGLGTADGWISNCYQKVYFDQNRNIKMFSGSGIFYGSTTGTALPYFAIRQYTPDGLVYVDQPDFTPQAHYNDAGETITIYENNGQVISLIGNGSVIIDFYSYGPTFYSELSITVDFIGANEAFKIQPIYQSCFTYENFQFNNDIVKLEGFCGSLEDFKIKLPADATNTMGLPPDFSMDINVPTMNSGAMASDGVNIPETACDNTTCAAYWSNACNCVVADPCGCVDFNLEFKLKPCPNTTMLCVSEMLISTPVRICCDCGYRGGEMGTPTGKNTATTALTGENSELTIFPNPNQSGKLQVSASGHPVQSIKIYAVDGKLVKNVTVKEAVNQVSVDVSNLQPGIYQVKVLDNTNAVSNQKLVIQ